MHPVWLRCENSEYPDIPPFSRLAGRSPQHPKLPTYFFANPQRKKETLVKRILWFSILLLVAIVPALRAEQPVDALKGPIDKVLQILEDPQYEDPARKADQREKIRSVSNAMFDFELIAKRATGRYHWENSFTSQQRQEFTDLFAEFLGNNYLTRINGTVKGLKVEYLDEVIDDSGKRAKVRTKIPGSNSDVAVDYSMRLRDGKWKIYDVYVEGVSLVQNYQSQFRSLFDKESAAQVIDRLKLKIEEQKHQNETSG
jgi:phospholipid transport system substrate-binding protein